jgi:predicted DNA-binding protein YlxM (UPF0122 family)
MSAAIVGLSAAAQDDQFVKLLPHHHFTIPDGTVPAAVDYATGILNGTIVIENQFNLKHIAEEINKHKKEIQDGIKTVSDITNGNLNGALNDGINIIGDVANNQLNLKTFIQKVGNFIGHHQKAIVDGVHAVRDITHGAGLDSDIQDGINVIDDLNNNQLNLKHIVHEISKHHKQIEDAVKLGAMIVANSEDDQLFNLKHIADELNKHQKEIQDGIKTVSDVTRGDVNAILNDGVTILGDVANNQLNLKTFINKVGNFIGHHQKAIVDGVHAVRDITHGAGLDADLQDGINVIDDLNNNQLFDLKHIAEEINKHQKAIQDGVKTVTDISNSNVNGILNDGVNIIDDVANNQLFGNKIRKTVREIINHRKQIGDAIKFGASLFADSEDEQLFNLKHIAEEINKHQKAIQDGIKTVTDITNGGDVNSIVNDGVNIIGDVANNQLFDLKHIAEEINKHQKAIQDGIKTVTDITNGGDVNSIVNDGVNIIGDVANNQLVVEKTFLGF